MNHDYAHCADFTPKCPRECFRAQLERDLKNHFGEYVGMPISYVRFRQEGLCQIEKGADDETIDA